MKKIMFNDKYGLTEAVLEGRKTMTRRIIQDKDHFNDYGNAVMRSATGFAELQPNYRIGEVVAVAQRYEDVYEEMLCNGTDSLENARPILKHSEDIGWENKMFVRADLMPHQILITNVRVERLQDISDEDCIREGIVKALGLYGCEGLCERGDQLYFNMPRAAFAVIIDKLSGIGTWESNPYCFVYEFELIK